MQNRAGAGVEQKWEKIGAGAEPPHWFPPDVYHLYLDEVEGRCGILSGPAAHLSQVSSAHPQRNISKIIVRMKYWFRMWIALKILSWLLCAYIF